MALALSDKKRTGKRASNGATKRVTKTAKKQEEEMSDFGKSVAKLASRAISGVYPDNASETKLRWDRMQEGK